MISMVRSEMRSLSETEIDAVAGGMLPLIAAAAANTAAAAVVAGGMFMAGAIGAGKAARAVTDALSEGDGEGVAVAPGTDDNGNPIENNGGESEE